MVAEVLRALTYGRNSSAKQKSIDDQNSENRQACEEIPARVVEELSDPSSASRYATKIRKNWARLLELAPTLDLVVLWEPSRGDRTLASWVAFLDLCREHGVRIHATSHRRTYDPANARDYRSLAEDGVDAAYESDKTSMRVRRGKAAAAMAGKPHGALLYGYERHYDSVKRTFVEQVKHPSQAPVVKDIYESLAAGEPLTGVCKRLTRAGVPTPQGAVSWLASTVRKIATNPSYRGVRVHDGQEYPAVWPALVAESTWRAVQRVLARGDENGRAARRKAAPGAVRYLLSGSLNVMTAPCGSPLVGNAGQPGRAANYVCRFDSCVSAPMRETDRYVTDLVIARLSKKDARRAWVADDTAARAAEEELARLRAELAEAQESFARPGGISAAAMAAKEAAMAPAIADAKRRARPAGVSLAMLMLLDAAKMDKEKVRPTWEGLALPAKREVIAGMFISLVLGKTTARITRATSVEERLAIVADRVESQWREPSSVA